MYANAHEQTIGPLTFSGSFFVSRQFCQGAGRFDRAPVDRVSWHVRPTVLARRLGSFAQRQLSA